MWRSMWTPLKGQPASPPWPCSATTSGCDVGLAARCSGRAKRQRTSLPRQNLEEKRPSSRTTPAGLSMPGLQATSHGMATTPASTPRRLMPPLGGLRAIASGNGIDRDGDEQHQRGDDVLRGCAEAEQAHAVIDRRDHDAADDAMHSLSAATEQACAADDGCGHRVQDEGATVQCSGDRTEP